MPEKPMIYAPASRLMLAVVNDAKAVLRSAGHVQEAHALSRRLGKVVTHAEIREILSEYVTLTDEAPE